MQDRKISSRDLIEIEDVQEDAEETILNEIKKQGFATRDMIRNNCGLTNGIMDNVIRNLYQKNIIVSTRKLVKFKGSKKYKNVKVYSMVGAKNGKRR